MIETIIVYGVVAIAAGVVVKRFWPRRSRSSGGCTCGKNTKS